MLYRAFGLNIESCIEFPELKTTQGDPDLFIKFGSLSKIDPDAPKGAIRYSVNEKRFRLQLESIGVFGVDHGQYITIDIENGVHPSSVTTVLLGSVFSALLTQRKIIQLHASAIKHPKGCVLFAGESGAGKSTLATGLMNRGYSILSDDVSAIDINDEGKPILIPSYPQMKLWKESVDHFNLDFDALKKIDHKYEKRALIVDKGNFYDQVMPVHRIYFLSTNEDIMPKITCIDSIEAFVVLRKCIFRMPFLQNPQLLKAFFVKATNLLDIVQTRKLIRPNAGLDQFEQFLDLIEADLEQ
ncbi:MAG: hypothetical protein JJ978_00620 [Roseivirga sp.]|jgi:hypothetical protein|uniref:hypothetical protein n=1 Tax=Roseivirga sp. TaxID=1964215 RepID=UPI001B092C84|nr:hypothetical protein [Roseivirga sp.]MBO6494042.1 hypothetical protein [Roseivirga sp.]